MIGGYCTNQKFMTLKKPITNLLKQLQYVIDSLSNEQYNAQIKVLSMSSIGQHSRHILEFFIELDNGYELGIVDYDKRVRSHAIESDKFFAVRTLQVIAERLDKPNRKISLDVEYGEGDDAVLKVNSNYYRELVYNLEHMVHHMALIRIGVEATTNLEIPIGFGIAASTLKFRKSCAQ
jgi:hypothetical protein